MTTNTLDDLLLQLVSQVWNAGKWEKLADLVASTKTALYPWHGPEQIRHYLSDYRRAFPNTLLTLEQTLIADKPTPDQPVSSQAVAKQSTTEQPAADQAATDQLAPEQTGADRPVAEQPATERPAVETTAVAYVISKNDQINHEIVLLCQIIDGKIVSLQSIPPLEEFIAKKESTGKERFTHLVNGGTNFIKRIYASTTWRNVVIVILMIIGIRLLMSYLNVYAKGLEEFWLRADSAHFDQTPEIRILPTVSTDGKRFVFATSNNLLGNDSNQAFDVFLYDSDSVSPTHIIPISVAVDPQAEANGWSNDPGISPDGRYVIFSSTAHNLVTDTLASDVNVYIRDLECRKTFLLDTFFSNTASSNLGQGQRCAAGNTSFLASTSLLPDMWWMPTSIWERLRLYRQHRRASELARRHLEIVMYYYQQYYVTVVMATLSVIGAAITLFYISRNGWNQSGPYAITIFMVLSASSIFFGALPNLFEYANNIDANKKAFVAASTLENQIASYISTGRVKVTETKTDEAAQLGVKKSENVSVTEPSSTAQSSDEGRLAPTDFIMRVDSQLVVLFELPVQLNADAIPSAADIVSNLQGTAPKQP